MRSECNTQMHVCMNPHTHTHTHTHTQKRKRLKRDCNDKSCSEDALTGESRCAYHQVLKKLNNEMRTPNKYPDAKTRKDTLLQHTKREFNAQRTSTAKTLLFLTTTKKREPAKATATPPSPLLLPASAPSTTEATAIKDIVHAFKNFIQDPLEGRNIAPLTATRWYNTLYDYASFSQKQKAEGDLTLEHLLLKPTIRQYMAKLTSHKQNVLTTVVDKLVQLRDQSQSNSADKVFVGRLKQKRSCEKSKDAKAKKFQEEASSHAHTHAHTRTHAHTHTHTHTTGNSVGKTKETSS